MNPCSRVENVKDKERLRISLLDLPEAILENIFERVSPADLCSVARVCYSLWEICTRDHLWGKQLTQKWGKLIGDAAYREWKSDVALTRSYALVICMILVHKKKKGLFDFIWNSRAKLESSSKAIRTILPVYSIKAFYLSLESGKFWFRAQIYYGETGGMLVCYDAQVRYDSRTNTFQARSASHGWWGIEENIEWDSLRAPQVDTPPYVLHVSDCLNDLKPGDHIEIQWTSHKEYPYDWWYAIIGHLATCDGNENYCRCHHNDTIVVEFNQYPPGSTWRRTMISRKYHPKEGNRVDGFYGGIRKLSDEEEIAKWLSYWQNQVMEEY